MELNITRLFKTINPKYYSASVAELGNDAGSITWENSLDAAPRLLKTKDQIQEFAQYIYNFGARTELEIKAFTVKECNALLLQLIAGDIREAGLDTKNPNWKQYELDSEKGRVSRNIYATDNGQVFYYIGS